MKQPTNVTVAIVTLSVLLAFSADAAIELPESVDTIVPEVVPEQELLSPKVAIDAPTEEPEMEISSLKTDPIQEEELIEAQDSEIKRTQICSAGMECTYRMHAKTDGMSHT